MKKEKMQKQNKYKRVEEVINSRTKYVRTTSTGYKGITIDKNGFKASFNIATGNKRVDLHLGNYETPEEAYIARLKFIDSLK